jgi:RNA recognition motif-containing protein
MNTKLYVGGIPYSSTNDDLKVHFGAAGSVVSAQIIIDKMTNRSKGFGFVEMSSEAEANKAIELFHDQDFQGRRLTVNIARPLAPREDRPRRAF